VLSHLDGKLSRYKIPTEVLFWDALPKSGYGKVAKAEVKKLLEAQDASQAA
jgi:acyl-CoA synthetase (AMP-forming)/AMP-acid ligase II